MLKINNLTFENSAQSTNSKPNPLLKSTLVFLASQDQHLQKDPIKIIDIGCGKLRHLETILNFSENVILVDTKYQIERIQKFAGINTTMNQFVSEKYKGFPTITITNNDELLKQNNNADIIISVNVINSIPRGNRLLHFETIEKNLSQNGYFLLIASRNDSSILKRCNIQNRFDDGYVFRNRGNDNKTFFHNFKYKNILFYNILKRGYSLFCDFSNYRNICAIFKKT